MRMLLVRLPRPSRSGDAAQADAPRKVMWRSTLTSLPAVGVER